VLSPLLKTLRQPPDYVEEYRNEFGYLGPALHTAVLKARTQPAPNPATSSACTTNATATTTPAPPTVAAPTPRSLSGQTAIVQTGLSWSFVLWLFPSGFLTKIMYVFTFYMCDTCLFHPTFLDFNILIIPKGYMYMKLQLIQFSPFFC
jgi:hypothetical protein